MRTGLLWIALPIAVLAAPSGEEIFQQRMAAVLAKNCAGCHGAANPQSGLSVASWSAVLQGGKRGAAVRPGSAAQSLLIRSLKGDGTPKMPLGGQLSAEDLQTLSSAIDAMEPLRNAPAKDPHFEWLLSKPHKTAEPAVRGKEWVKNPIDAFVLAKLESEGLTPAPAADKRSLIRRAYFDLIGLPPSPEQVRAFVADDSAKAYEKVIDQLLEDPRYGERWGRHWLDLVRFAESDGFAIDGERATAWRYRDYVIRAFQKDKPYDVFVQEQLAGDEFRGKNGGSLNERLVAMGFLRMGPWEADANSKKQLRQDFLNEVTATVSNVFLGVTAGCAQCHNHKYDPIPQRDYYRLQAFFAATGPAEIPIGYDAAEKPAEMKRLMRQHEDDAEKAQVELDKQKEALKQRYMRLMKVGEKDDGLKKFLAKLNTRNLFFLEQDLPLVKEPEWREPMKAYFTTRDGMTMHQEYARRYKEVAYTVRDVAPPAVPEIPDTYILAAGDLAARTEKVEPGFFECVTGKAEPAVIPFAGGSNGRRLALAEWIASPENPLTARVMVNRIWQHHFGDGIVRTPSDFGKNGDTPSHPQLLDWLASEFIAKGWSMKAMHRLMLTSNAYQQASRHPLQKQYAVKDPNNRLLWRMNWQRLDAEALRDSILHLSQRLTPGGQGPGVFFPVSDDVAQGFEFFKWFPSSDEEQRRRSVYLFQRRSVILPMAETFDAPNLSASCSRRQSTIVAPQALTLLNGALTREEAKHFAARLMQEASTDEARIGRAFQLVLAREPSALEMQQLQPLAAKGAAGLESLVTVLFNLNEFLYVE